MLAFTSLFTAAELQKKKKPLISFGPEHETCISQRNEQLRYMEEFTTLIIESQNKGRRKVKIENQSACLLSQLTQRPVWNFTDERAEVRRHKLHCRCRRLYPSPNTAARTWETVLENGFQNPSVSLFSTNCFDTKTDGRCGTDTKQML